MLPRTLWLAGTLIIVATALIAALVNVIPAPATAPSLIWHATITDTSSGEAVPAAIMVDDRRVASGVTQADVRVPADGQLHYLRVIAEGYHPWAITLHGVPIEGQVLHSPVQLVPVEATQHAQYVSTK